MSQGQARQRKFNANYILISIQDPDEPPVELPKPLNCRGILRLQFDDVTDRRDGLVLFSSEQALEILDFVHEHHAEVKMIACHCKMGMCRSPAVLAALATVMGQDDSFLRDERGRPKYRPNRYVYETLVHEGRRHELGEL
ncbi:MAG: hypothetical protein ACRYFS_11180 [Janthinobacterium lividum]